MSLYEKLEEKWDAMPAERQWFWARQIILGTTFLTGWIMLMAIITAYKVWG